MTISFASRTILEKAAVDNGFSLGEDATGDWLLWKAHAAPARLCLTVTEVGYGIGSDHLGAIRDLGPELTPLPNAPTGFRAVEVNDSQLLNSVAGAVWRLARSLPDEPLRQYHHRLAEPPDTTEAERLRKERIGQDVFREALMLFWNGACAVTGVGHPRLLRASHIIPWAKCESDAERLNVHNGLLLAAHLDAAFDAALISFDDEGKILFHSQLKGKDQSSLGLGPHMRLRAINADLSRRLAWHRSALFTRGKQEKS